MTMNPTRLPTKESNCSNLPINRRKFLAGAGASVLAFSVLKPELVGAAEANSKIDIGLIGCGGRGKWITELFRKHGGYNVVALADYFPEQVTAAGDQFQVPAERRFTGLSGYRKLLDQKLDAVVIESPPYFHPEHAEAAVNVGKHVYLAKPIAVDVPGCLTVEESGKKATQKKTCFLVDFQTRTNKLYQEAARKVHSGELGKIISGEAAYHCGPTWDGMDKILRTNPNDPETRLRAWGMDQTLSGDIITEQNIHAIDVACWMLRGHPIKAYGTSAKRRDLSGNCHDVFSVIYHYPNGVVVTFNSHQSGFGYDDILCRVFGMEGTVDTHYFGQVSVKTKESRSAGDVGNLYTDGAAANIAAFHQNVTKGDCSNPTVAESVRSNLTTILGRTAAYREELVTWDQMMKKREKWAADLKGLKEA
jgi:predicted dehydrogenase